jgi:hemerythrin superfamily protein
MPSDLTSSGATDDDIEGEGDGDAIDLLTTDHEEVKQLFAEYDELVSDDADAEERKALALQICDALTAHATIEEEIFYPAARDAIDDRDLLDEAEAEHASAKDLIEQIRGMDIGDARFDATLRLLQEAIDHHVHEEEGELFPLVQEAGLDLQALGEQMMQRREEVLAELEEGQAD